ncbi:MAG: type II toxin-antitoxin system death-on-curing family toxin [Pseudomonadota bacterium]
MSTTWLWVHEEVVRIIHQEQLAEHGGGEGVRDSNMLASALARPRNLDAYDEPDVAALAAAYAFAIARNHPFVDGNKRTAAVVAELFLDLHGYVLEADDVELVIKMTALAAGDLDEGSLATWYRDNIGQR